MVVKAVIQAELIAMATELRAEQDPEQGIIKWADKMSTLIMNAILSAQVVAGQTVVTTGSAVTQTGATTTPGTLI